MLESIAILEISALGAALFVLDRIEKSTPVRLLQAELNDFYGYVLKLTGPPAAVQVAVETGRTTARQLQANCTATVILSVAPQAWPVVQSRPEFQPLINQPVVFVPANAVGATTEDIGTTVEKGGAAMAQTELFAIGLIETQGFTAVIEAIDTACKAANVEVIGKEKLGGGYITVLIKGDVAAVTAAVEAGKSKVGELGKLIAAHVIPRPSASLLRLMTPL